MADWDADIKERKREQQELDNAGGLAGIGMISEWGYKYTCSFIIVDNLARCDVCHKTDADINNVTPKVIPIEEGGKVGQKVFGFDGIRVVVDSMGKKERAWNLGVCADCAKKGYFVAVQENKVLINKTRNAWGY